MLSNPLPSEARGASPNVLTAEALPIGELSLDETSITLYAELLLNIRTVTLFGSLRTVRNKDTKAQLSTDGYTITVSHEGESATIRLPVKAKGGGDAALNLPADPQGKELSIRLQIEEQEGSDLFTGVHAEERKANVVPWDGAALNAVKGIKIMCMNCKSPIVSTGKVTEWRDLPNENWAEMMDFWHCHKPDEHHLHGHTHKSAIFKKGYAAGTRLEAVQGVGFVDLATLLLKEQDCEGVQVGCRSSSIVPIFPPDRHFPPRSRSPEGDKKMPSAFLHGKAVDTTHPKLTTPTRPEHCAYPLREEDGLPVTLGRGPAFHWRLPEILGSVRIKPGYIRLPCTNIFVALPDAYVLYMLCAFTCPSITYLTMSQLAANHSQNSNLLTCRSCNHPLGVPDLSASGWRLWKWSIRISSTPHKLLIPDSYSTQKWTSARLIHLIENQGVRKFHIHPDTDDKDKPVPSLLVWVFTPDLLFSSSIRERDRKNPTRAMKVFFQEKTWRPPRPGEVESATIEDVAFPETLFAELKGALEESQMLLPGNARMFQGWRVGLLERFDIGEGRVV
jgi:hypothetical protein